MREPGASVPCSSESELCADENYLNFDPPQPTGDGGFAITVAYGDTAVPHQAVADLGPLVVAVLDNPTKHIGATIGIAAEYLTAEAAAATLSKELGVPIKARPCTRQDGARRRGGFPPRIRCTLTLTLALTRRSTRAGQPRVAGGVRDLPVPRRQGHQQHAGAHASLWPHVHGRTRARPHAGRVGWGWGVDGKCPRALLTA